MVAKKCLSVNFRQCEEQTWLKSLSTANPTVIHLRKQHLSKLKKCETISTISATVTAIVWLGYDAFYYHSLYELFYSSKPYAASVWLALADIHECRHTYIHTYIFTRTHLKRIAPECQNNCKSFFVLSPRFVHNLSHFLQLITLYNITHLFILLLPLPFSASSHLKLVNSPTKINSRHLIIYFRSLFLNQKGKILCDSFGVIFIDGEAWPDQVTGWQNTVKKTRKREKASQLIRHAT